MREIKLVRLRWTASYFRGKKTGAQICALGQQWLTMFKTQWHYREEKKTPWHVQKSSLLRDNNKHRSWCEKPGDPPFPKCLQFGKAGSLWLWAFHRYLHSYSWTHTLVMSLGHNPDGCIKQKRGGLELKREKKGKRRCDNTAWKLQLKQYQRQKWGKMGIYGWVKKKKTLHTPGSKRWCGQEKG